MTKRYLIPIFLTVLFSCKTNLKFYDDISSDGGFKRQKMIRKYTKKSHRKLQKLRKAK